MTGFGTVLPLRRRFVKYSLLAFGLLIFSELSIELSYRLPLGGDALFSWGFSAETVDFEKNLFAGFLLTWLFFYGIYRVYGFHPAAQPEYRHWLRTLPWHLGKPLVMGPVTLVWQDAAILLACSALPAVTNVLPVQAGFFAFALPYSTLAALATFDSNDRRLAYTILLGFALAIFFAKSLLISPFLITITLAMASWGFRQNLAFSLWEEKCSLLIDAALLVQEGRVRQKTGGTSSVLTGWPLDFFFRPIPAIHFSFLERIGLSILAGGYLFGLLRFVPPDTLPSDIKLIHFFAGFLMFILAAIRLAIYVFGAGATVVGIYAPPISFFGRIATGRWIIPGYDNAFVAPILSFLAAVISMRFLYGAGVSMPLAISGSSILFLALLLTLGPSFLRWCYTAPCRITEPANNGVIKRI